MWLSFARGDAIDERYLLHRDKSTSHAGIVAAAPMGGWIAYDGLRDDRLRWDDVIVLGLMVVVKWSFMFWYRAHD